VKTTNFAPDGSSIIKIDARLVRYTVPGAERPNAHTLNILHRVPVFCPFSDYGIFSLSQQADSRMPFVDKEIEVSYGRCVATSGRCAAGTDLVRQLHHN